MYLLKRLNKYFKKKKLNKKVKHVYNNPNIPFLLSLYGKDDYIQMEIIRQYQLNEEITTTDDNGFAVFIIVEFNKNHKENIKKLNFFNELILIESDIEKYLYLCDDNVKALKEKLTFFKEKIFETIEGESYYASIKTFTPAN